MSDSWMTETQKMYRAAGICVRCGQRDAKLTSIYCPECADKRAEYNRRWTERNGQKRRDYAHGRYEAKVSERRSAGLCISCGKRPAKAGRVRCEMCLAKDRESHKRSARKRGAITWDMRGDGLHCFTCCRPICSGQKICEDCRTKLAEASKKGLEKISALGLRKNHIWKRQDQAFYAGRDHYERKMDGGAPT